MGDSMFFYDENILHVGNFKKVLYVENELIIILLIKKRLEIYGNNLLIIELNDDELYIQGEIKEVDIKDE
jgi:hypothetical protein